MKSSLALIVVVLSVFAFVQPNAAFMDFFRNFGKPHKGPSGHDHHGDKCVFKCLTYNQTSKNKNNTIRLDL